MTPKELMKALMEMENRELALGIYSVLEHAEDIIGKLRESAQQLGGELLQQQLINAVMVEAMEQAISPDDLYKALMGGQVVVYPDGSGHVALLNGGQRHKFNTAAQLVSILGLSKEEPTNPIEDALRALDGYEVDFTDHVSKYSLENRRGQPVQVWDSRAEAAEDLGIPLNALTHDDLARIRVETAGDGVLEATVVYRRSSNHDVYNGSIDTAAQVLRDNQDEPNDIEINGENLYDYLVRRNQRRGS